jgi:Zn ribbon nucleic-acid-binding protein
MTASFQEPARARPRESTEEPRRHVEIGDQECPRCGKTFTLSYWTGDTMIQARCLSCDLKWPRPDVV